MLPFAYFGINSSGFTVAVDLLLLGAVVLYVCLVYWTLTDARRRIADPLLIGCAFVVSLVPFIGPLVYLILRPPEFLVDVQQRELEIQAGEARLHQLDYGLCPHCNYPVERDFLRCPSCLRKLKERCVGCSRPLDPAWTICPYCETEVPGAIQPPRRLRERGTPSGAPLTTASEATQAFTGDPFAEEVDQFTAPFVTEDPLGPAGEPQAEPISPHARSRRPPRPSSS
jgi:hypothetical protein